MTQSPSSFLDKIQIPDDLKMLNKQDLPALCAEIRADLLDIVSKTGGHLGAGLGVVELTVALHYVFNTPHDRLIWDVGHQAYPHKMLTGRREKMHTIRQNGGLSGFTKRAESPYDPFGAGHSSTSISAALGMASAFSLNQEQDRHVIAVIGDGSMSAGMAYEALNNAGALGHRLIVILNDNDMSIDRPTGALSQYLARIVSSKSYHALREHGKPVVNRLPKPLRNFIKNTEESARSVLGDGSFFENLGFYYIGCIDGHHVTDLVSILDNVKQSYNAPVLIHMKTQKGKGYDAAEQADDKMHGVTAFDVETGKALKKSAAPLSFSHIFGHSLIKLAESDSKIVAITAAMPSGTGLIEFQNQFPDRCFDVGIAEQHAVTFAAGLACEGHKPFVAIYSTFLQRAYDQIIHDVALQNLPVRFVIDRAGLVGADGQTHAGAYDIAYLSCIPNMVLMAPSDEQELTDMVQFASQHDSSPIAFRFPRGNGALNWHEFMPDFSKQCPIQLGKGRFIQQGNEIAILSYGTRLYACQQACTLFTEKTGIPLTIADARFAKPLDLDLIQNLSQTHKAILTIEEGSIGGFGSAVLHALNDQNALSSLHFLPLFLPDQFIDHGSMEAQYQQTKIDVHSILQALLTLYKKIA